MKANKAPDAGVEVSPSQKKLKQARLPFKLISEVAPVSDSPNSRKRKLSVQENETAPKVGKIAKENGALNDPVVISDEEGTNTSKRDINTAVPNPFVKLVDAAIKKKLKKSNTPKKKKNNKKNDTVIYNCVEVECDDAMEVDEPVESVTKENNNETLPKPLAETVTSVNEPELQTSVDTIVKSDDVESKIGINTSTKRFDTIIELEDSNNSSHETKSTDPMNDKCKIVAQKHDNESTGKENNKSTEVTSKIAPVTPKRSPRVKATKSEDNSCLYMSTSSSKDESMTSNPCTPKQKRNANKSASGEELNDASKSLTPKQLQKKLESAKKREKHEQEKLEREKKRQQEKEERDKVKKEKEDQKKKEREEKEEAKRKEREEKEKQKEQEKRLREEKEEQRKKEKEEKEEQKKKEREEKEEQKKREKEAREEEKRKKQEAVELEKQEQELKKKKAAEAFANFFVTKQKTDKDQAVIGPVIQNNMLSSFVMKSDMRLAPTVRQDFTEDRKNVLDGLLKKQGGESYLTNLKNGAKPAASGKTWPLSDRDDDVMIVEDELPALDGVGEILTCESAVRERLKPKLFSFHENRRPPYWGTWRKRSAVVKPRTPFKQDEKHLDYEVDSDDDWEEEAEGESLDGSAAGSDTEPADNDEYEVDNEVFVPHGYLSDEEATMDEEDEKDILSLSPETQKARLKHLEDEFESEMKKPTEKLKPRLYGLIWETSEGGRPEKCVDALWNYFSKLAMVMEDTTPLLQPAPETEETEKKKSRKKKPTPEGEQTSPKSEKKKKAKTEKLKPEAKKVEPKKNTPEPKKNQLGINSFLTKLKST